jgi:hypothetical protein
MADIIDIDVFQTVTSVSFEVEPNTDIININKVTTSGYTGVPNLQEVTNQGATTNNPITANSFVKSGGTGTNVLLDNGNTVALSSIGGATNLSPTQTATNFTINSDTGTDATIPLGNGTLAGATLNDYTTTEKNKLAGIQAGANLGVPYTGATSDVNLGEFGIQLGNLEFDNTPTNIPTAAGSMYYNDADGTLDLILKGGNVKLQIGQESVVRVVNKTSTNIDLLEANYQAVRVTGAQGQRLKVDLAQATNDLLSAETIGLATETIANNQEGFITTSGLVRNINTTGSLQSEMWLDGDVLYLSPTVAGRITKVKPQAPNHLVIIGYVIHAHATQGTIFVKVDNGYEISELHDVKITTPANNNVLAYTSATDIWENKTVETALGFTPYNATNPSGYQTAAQVQTIADAKVANTITNGVTTSAPNQDVVFDALALKANDSTVVHNTGTEIIAGAKTFSSNPKIPINGGNSGAGAIIIDDGAGQIEVANNLIYPNTTELSYLKGVTSGIQSQFSGKVSNNTVITGATKTKITYDAKGLVTAGADIATTDISDFNSASRAQTEAELIAGSNITITPAGTGATRTLTIASTGGGASSQDAYTVLANNTNASAIPTAQVYKDIAEQTYSLSPTFTVTAPTTIVANTYKWNQVGSLVTIRVNLIYTTAGSFTQVVVPLPADMPTPLSPTGLTGASDILYYGTGMFNTSTVAVATITRVCFLRRNSANTGYEFVMTHSSAIAARALYLTLQYFT